MVGMLAKSTLLEEGEWGKIVFTKQNDLAANLSHKILKCEKW